MGLQLTDRTATDILKEMIDLATAEGDEYVVPDEAKNANDAELAHVRADELLVEAMRIIAGVDGDTYRIYANELIKAFNEVPKCYA